MGSRRTELESPLNEFVSGIKAIIDGARGNAVRSVDFCRVRMYWAIGQRIAEKEQQGKERAGYGTYLIKNLAKQLQPEYGSGFSVRQLEMCRQFYRIYPIANTLCSQLNWSQYKLLSQSQTPTNESTINWKPSMNAGLNVNLSAKSTQCFTSVF